MASDLLLPSTTGDGSAQPNASMMEEVWNSIDLQSALIEKYKKIPLPGYDRNFQELEAWMRTRQKEDDNRPLLLLFPPEMNQVHFFTQFLEYHKQISDTNEPEYLIPVLASLGGNMTKTSHTLHFICNKLREHFDLTTRISLNEQHLKKFFHSVLCQASDRLNEKVVSQKDIILFFEHIDRARGGPVKNWLPKKYPERVKCIIACESGREADIMTRIDHQLVKVQRQAQKLSEIEELLAQSYGVFAHQLEQPEVEEHVPQLSPVKGYTTTKKKALMASRTLREQFTDPKAFNLKLARVLLSIEGSLQGNFTFAQVFMGLLGIPLSESYLLSTDRTRLQQLKFQHTDFKELKLIRSVGDVLEYVMKLYRQEMNSVGDKKYETVGTKSVDHFEELLKYLTVTQKGLTEKELEQLANMGQAQLRLGFEIFEPFLLYVNGCYKLYHEQIAEYITKCWIVDNQVALCKSMGEVLESTPNSMRKLEELIYVLIESKAWFQLKQAISTIENFLILFNPEHKFALGNCWGTLVAQHYDPVVEYNKSLELFEMHYQPTIEDLFRIVLQLSRFLKELVDFEAPDSLPEFKHPVILNRFLTGDHNPKFLKHKKQSNKARNSEAEQTKNTAGSTFSNFGIKERPTATSTSQIDDFRLRPEEFSIESFDDEVEDHDAGVCINYLADIGLLRELKRMTMYDQSGENHILNEVEKINVDIPGGREKYIDHFRQLILSIKEKKRPSSLEEPEEGSKAGSTTSHLQSTLKPLSTLDPRSRPTSIYNSVVSKTIQQGPNSLNGTLNRNLSNQPSRDLIQNSSLFGDRSQTSTTGSRLKPKLGKPGQDQAQDEVFESGAVSSSQNPQELSAANEGDQKLTFYFYKRWLWIMFPWACMNIKDSSSFSSQIKKCFTSNIKYIKVKDELELTKLALGIAIKAKMKKKLVLNTLRGDFLMDERLTQLESKILHIQTQRTSVGNRGTEPSGGYGSSN